MNKRASLPVEGKALRFAPGRDQEPATRFWKIWAEGNEVYTSTRAPQGLAKISVHASGQIHWRLGPKLKQDLAPLMPLGGGHWMHAFEIRFLLSQGAKAPSREKESSLKNKSGYVIPVTLGRVLYANLIIGAAGAPLNCPLPSEFAGQALWRTQLRDGRPAILLGRMLPLDSENRGHIEFIREKLRPTATVSGAAREAYVEILHLHWSPEGGNVVLVVPMGDEAIRSEQEITTPIGSSTEPRMFRYQSPYSTTEIVAPNGLQVAVLELDRVDKQFELVKNQPSTHSVGVLKMRLQSSNLIAGSKFIASPCRLVCVPAVGGGSPRAWEYTCLPRFDGFALSVEVQKNSISLRNSNLAAAVSQLDNAEELVLAIPSESLTLVATMAAPIKSIELIGRFTLRDSRQL